MTARQKKALAALLNSSTQDEAAKAAGIATRTIKTYLQDEAFRQEYRSRLTELCENAARKAQRELSRSVDTLTALRDSKNTPPAQRIAAAKTIIDSALRLREQIELEDRITALEKRLSDCGEGWHDE